MKKINVAELLRNCPNGMELDCTMYENTSFLELSENESDEYPIIVRVCDKYIIHLTKEGCWVSRPDAKCIIFPKGKTTWEGFHRPFKDGDIIADEHGNIAIYKGEMRHNKKLADYYCGYRNADGKFLVKKDIEGHFGHIEEKHLATEEEKDKLFQAIKDNGYKWNEKTNTLETLPKFKVGDRIQGYGNHVNHPIRVVKSLECDRYRLDNCTYVKFGDEHAYKLLKFDISTLVPFESRVLVRAESGNLWKPAIFGCYVEDKYAPYYVLGGTCWSQCIPYERNEHLRGKTDDCDEFYKTWE